MGRLIAFVGWSRARRKTLTDTVPKDWSSFLAPDEFRRGSWKPYKGAVLGDQALRVLDPDALAKRVVQERLRLLLCPVAAGGECVGTWQDSGLGRVVPYDHLEHELQLTMPYFERPYLGVDDVLDSDEFDIHTVARDAFDQLNAIDRPTANAWAASLGITRHALRRLCLNGFGVPSETILWIWLSRGVTEVRGAGATLEDAAHVYGYSNAGSLHRAFKRRGMEVPPRGPFDLDLE